MESILNIIFAFMIGFMLCYIYRHNSNHNVVYKEDKEDKKDNIENGWERGYKLTKINI